jgi:conjugal transfer mating pair stabilization protein TraG
MLEVFTIGGGEYVVNVLNAVAAWTGGGGYRSLLRVVMVMGLAYSLCVVAFSLDWRAWLNWFLQSTAIYMMLMVPTVTVKVTDRIDPSLGPSVVDNVPLGLGVMASFTSQIGDWMTRQAETVFVMPNAVALSNNGMIYGARLLEKARSFQITDSVFRANLDEQMKQCVFYDVLLGFKSMDTLTRSNNVWAAMAPGSPARSQKWITSTGAGTTESSIIPCNEAYSRLDATFNAEIEKDILPFSRGAYPKLVDTVAAQKMRDDLPIVAAHMHGSATDAYSYLKQVSTIDAFLQARESFSDAGWDAYASQRADAQAKNTYTSIAQQAMTWVPLLGIVLTVVFYAMFPVLFPLFLFPRTGVSTLKGYAVGFFYLASWGPLYVILHMFVMSRAANAYHAVAPSGPTLLIMDGIDSVNTDISTLAGFLMMSVPFLAAGMARGAMAIAGQATSMLMPAQNAAEQAATERTTGNYSYGNTSFQNLTSNMTQANKWDDQPKYNSGFGVSTFTNADGGITYGFADGGNAYDTRQGISSLSFTPSRTAGFDQQMSRALSEGQNHTQQVRAAASQSWQATATTGTELLNAAEHRVGSSTETGSGFNNSVAAMTEVTRSISQGIQRRTGLSEADSDNIARATQTSGDANAGLSAAADIFKKFDVKGKAEIGARLATIASETTGRTVTAEQAYSDFNDYLRRETNTTQSRNARDDFMRETSTSGDSRIQSLSRRLGVSLNESRSASLEASQAEEAYSRFSHDVREAASRGYSLNRNETQEFVTYATERLLEDPTLAAAGWHPSMVMPRTREQAQARDILLNDFMDQKVKDVRQELGIDVPEHLTNHLTGPAITTGAGVQAWADRRANAIEGQGPDVSVRASSRDTALATEVAEAIPGGSARITSAALGLGNEVDDAKDRGVALGAYVEDRNGRSLLGTAPIIGPTVRNISDAGGRALDQVGTWAADHLGIGSHVAALPSGERATLPISGQIRSNMGTRIHPITGRPDHHNGVDIAAAAGTEIRAPASGTVLRNDFQANGAGNYVVLGHADGSESKYFHMQNRSDLEVGSKVSAGEVVGQVGSSGRATGPHLHYELWKDGAPVDPRRHELRD